MIFKMAAVRHLEFWGPVMGSWKAHVGFLSVVNRDHSSKLLTFWENRVFVYAFWRQTDKQTNRWTKPMRKGAVATNDDVRQPEVMIGASEAPLMSARYIALHWRALFAQNNSSWTSSTASATMLPLSYVTSRGTMTHHRTVDDMHVHATSCPTISTLHADKDHDIFQFSTSNNLTWYKIESYTMADW